MATATKPNSARKNLEHAASQQFAHLFQAFLECSDAIQQAIREMAAIINDPHASHDEIEAAISTISEALFPHRHNGKLGVDLEEADSIDRGNDEYASEAGDLDAQEETFAERVIALLEQRDMKQADLADAIGVGQPAISMMLSRNCRPQKKTVEKVAKVLGVLPSDIWPEEAD